MNIIDPRLFQEGWEKEVNDWPIGTRMRRARMGKGQAGKVSGGGLGECPGL